MIGHYEVRSEFFAVTYYLRFSTVLNFVLLFDDLITFSVFCLHFVFRLNRYICVPRILFSILASFTQ